MQKNYNKIPQFIYSKLDSIKNVDIIVAVVKKFNSKEIDGENLVHLGVQNSKALANKLEVFPLKKQGRYSRRNLDGYSVIKYDKPKINKTIYCGERPIWGNYNNGSFSLYINKLVYQRSLFPPKEIAIGIEVLNQDQKSDQSLDITLKFEVLQVLNKTAPNFEDNLFFNINLLQENVGAIDIFNSTATSEDYLKTTIVHWELLPPGERDENLVRILSKIRNPTPQMVKNVKDRYDLLMSMNPINIIEGSSGMRRYLGAMFSEYLVVFENVEYGNAIYIMYEEWKELSKLTRIQLLADTKLNYDRIEHRKGWETRLADLVKAKLK